MNKEQKPFRRELFLFRALAAVFAGQFAIICFSYFKCAQFVSNHADKTVQEICPNLSKSTENLFGVATATVLSLLGAGLAGKDP